MEKTILLQMFGKMQYVLGRLAEALFRSKINKEEDFKPTSVIIRDGVPHTAIEEELEAFKRGE